MSSSKGVWVLVLAGGEGKRLRVLTTEPCGTPVPKQFCSLRGERSLIEEAIDRGAALVDTERICAIVAAEHRRWWSESAAVARLASANLIVQPRNRGTAVGILYAALHIAAKDPDATIVLLPSDHHVADESILRESQVAALQAVRRHRSGPVLLGLEPDTADTELGYIVPGDRDSSGCYRVRRFVEKPSITDARSLIQSGALWNMFIVVAALQGLIDLFRPQWGALIAEMRALVAAGQSAGLEGLRGLNLAQKYERLPEVDFSRHVLAGQESALRLMRVRPCGWSDLGTPRRVSEMLRRLAPRDYAAAVSRRSAYVNLAAQHDRMQRQA
jgi:mannose-1-phosphate guanylyltransferase